MIAICCRRGLLYPLSGECGRVAVYRFRESLASNDQLKDARKEIGVAIKDYLRGLVQNDRAMFNRILDVHHFHIKAIASEDNELLRLFMDYLPF